MSKNLSDNSLIQSDVMPLLFDFAVEHAIRKVQEYHVGLKLNGAHQVLGCVDDVNHLGDNIDA
jgi:hypothetical protein